MKKINPKSCLLCRSNNYRIIFSYIGPDEYETAIGVGKKGYFRKWVQCRNCGLYYSIYSRPRNALNKVYGSVYRDKNSPWRKESPEESFKKIMAFPQKKSEIKFRVNWIKKNIADIWECGLVKKDASPHKALDIGGGVGMFAHEFRNTDWTTHVIDPDKNSNSIKTKLHIPFVQSFYKPRSFNCKFTLISLIYVLEHLSNPLFFLKSARKDMTKNSFLFIEVPDILSFRFKPAKDDIFNSCHLWMFSPETLIRLLSDCGFEVFNLRRIKTIRGHYALMALASPKK